MGNRYAKSSSMYTTDFQEGLWSEVPGERNFR